MTRRADLPESVIRAVVTTVADAGGDADDALDLLDVWTRVADRSSRLADAMCRQAAKDVNAESDRRGWRWWS